MTANPKLSVWHVLEAYPPAYGGGAAVTTRDLCRGLAARGHDVRVICVERTESTAFAVRSERDEQVRVDRVNLPYFFDAADPEGWGLDLRGTWRHERGVDGLLGRLLLEGRPDLVDYHTSRPFGEQGLTGLAARGIPIVATLHDYWLICARVMLLRSPQGEACSGPGALKCHVCLYSHYNDRGILVAGLKLPWRLARLGLVPSYRLRRRRRARRVVAGAWARSEFVAAAHRPHLRAVRHIQFGVSAVSRSSLPPVRPRAPMRFGFFGGTQPNKGLSDVLDAASALRDAGLPFGLWLYGPGDCRAEVERRGLGDHVRLGGLRDPDDMAEAYDAIDVAVMASRVPEPLGRIPLEAASSGAPSIVPAIGGLPETIADGENGLLFRFRDVPDLARQMRRVIEDTGLMARLLGGVRPPTCADEGVAAVERFYYEVLGRTVVPASLPHGDPAATP